MSWLHVLYYYLPFVLLRMQRENICSKAEWKNISLFDLTSQEVYVWHFPLITLPPEDKNNFYIKDCAWVHHRLFVYNERVIKLKILLFTELIIRWLHFGKSHAKALNVMNFFIHPSIQASPIRLNIYQAALTLLCKNTTILIWIIVCISSIPHQACKFIYLIPRFHFAWIHFF